MNSKCRLVIQVILCAKPRKNWSCMHQQRRIYRCGRWTWNFIMVQNLNFSSTKGKRFYYVCEKSPSIKFNTKHLNFFSSSAVTEALAKQLRECSRKRDSEEKKRSGRKQTDITVRRSAGSSSTRTKRIADRPTDRRRRALRPLNVQRFGGFRRRRRRRKSGSVDGGAAMVVARVEEEKTRLMGRRQRKEDREEEEVEAEVSGWSGWRRWTTAVVVSSGTNVAEKRKPKLYLGETTQSSP